MGLIISDEYFPAPRSKAMEGRSHGVSKTLPPWAKNSAISKNPAKMARAIPERDVSRFTLKDAAYSFLMGALSPLFLVSALFSGCNGGVRWTRQPGSTTEDRAYGIALDKDENIYVTGHTYGDLDGNKNAGSYSDIFLIKFDSSGWTRQMGSTTEDAAFGVTVDENGNIYITGETQGDLAGNKNAGGRDIFLLKFAGE